MRKKTRTSLKPISLNAYAEKLVRDKLFRSKKDVFNTAVIYLKGEAARRRAELEYLHEEILKGVRDAEAGRVVDGPTYMAHLGAKLERAARTRSSKRRIA